MSQKLYILDEDKEWAKARIAELDQSIVDLGPEFNDVFNQSSETWHDNAPFDALRDRQSVLDAERQKLRQVLRDSLPSVPNAKPGVISIGSSVVLQDMRGYTKHIKIAGDWTPFPGEIRDGILTISSGSPLANDLIGARSGDEVLRGRVIEVST